MNSGPNVTEASNAEAEAFQASGAGKALRIQETVSKEEVDMTYEQIKEIARERGIRIAGVKKVDVVRAIQVQEGNEPCFATGRASECSQMHCLWLKACE